VLSRAFADFVESDFDLERVGEYPVRGFADPIELFAYQPTSVSVVASPVTTL
jgi:adenylate cyclase